MPILRTPRKGRVLKIKGRRLSYSYWPTYQGESRIGLQSVLFALDPWTIINASVKKHCPQASRNEALAYIEQAQDFYTAAASAGIAAARPLLLYYCFLNLVKAFVIHRGAHNTFGQSGHGLRERLNPPGRELEDAFLIAEKSPNSRGNMQVFDEFLKVVRGSGLPNDSNFSLRYLLPQVVPGHRLWAEAANEPERFVVIHEIEVMEETAAKILWLRMYLFHDDLTRLGLTHKQLMIDSNLAGTFRTVKTGRSVDGRKLVCFEQIATTTYHQRPSDVLHQLVGGVRQFLWATVATVPPYRRYYLYLCPSAERGELLPQVLSIYAITFYLGSITRYRPHHFDGIVDNSYGPRIEEFISGQPLQFIYLMASEFALQDVTKPSIV
jgi:hypothetical protein